MDITLTNTASRKKEVFTPLSPGHVGMYHCGPTVYDYAHIGNLRAFIFADMLRRMFEASGYTVKQVINITDVGHLTGENEGKPDEGEDKIEKGAKREGKSVEDIIGLYTEAFIADFDALNILRPHEMPRATKHLGEQIRMIEALEKKGHTYRASTGIYFDSSTFPRYADFAHLDLAGLKKGARIGVDEEKRNPYDFALWKFSGKEKRLQEWDSPWGKGFPGWHIECSAMSMKYLGETFDIHTGGIDLIPVHHTNEIAQSECATRKPFVRVWMHSGFMTVDGEKMSKSLGNTYRLSDLVAKGVSPQAFRYWILSAKYDTQLNFTWDALMAAETTIRRYAMILAKNPKKARSPITGSETTHYLRNDLDTPGVIAMLSSLEQEPEGLARTLDLLGIDVSKHIEALKRPIPDSIMNLTKKRDEAREKKDWKISDSIRTEIEGLGYIVEDTPGGTKITPKISF